MDNYRIGDLVKVKKGKKHTFEENLDKNLTRVIQIGDLRNNENKKYTKDEKGVLVTPSDVIIAWDGANAGTIGYGKTGFIGSTLARLRILDKSIVNSIFLGKFLQSKFSYLRKTATGATIPHINRKALESIKLPNLSLSDQKRIAKVLSHCEDLIAKRKESIDLLDEFVKSTFLEMFGDPAKPKYKSKKLLDFAVKITDGTHQSPKFVEKGVPFLLVSNIVDNEIDFNVKKYITEEEYLLLNKRTPIERGDILITSVGSYGNPALVKERTKFAFQRHIAYIKPNHEKIDSVYLFGALKSDIVKHQIERVVRGVAQKTLNLTQLKKIKIPHPPNHLQLHFAELIKNVDKIKAQFKESLLELEHLYGSLSQQAFKGELDLSKVEIDLFDNSNVFPPDTIQKNVLNTKKELDLGKLIKKNFNTKLFSIEDLEKHIIKKGYKPSNIEIKNYLQEGLKNRMLIQVYDEDLKKMMFKLN